MDFSINRKFLSFSRNGALIFLKSISMFLFILLNVSLLFFLLKNLGKFEASNLVPLIEIFLFHSKEKLLLGLLIWKFLSDIKLFFQSLNHLI